MDTPNQYQDNPVECKQLEHNHLQNCAKTAVKPPSCQLKYLFSVVYRNGSTYSQSSSDVSVKDPIRSAFFDVDVPAVKKFTLNSSSDTNTYTVDVDTGTVTVINGSATSTFSLVNITEKMIHPRIIYYRTVKKDFDQNFNSLTTHTAFNIGLQFNDQQGNSIKRIITIQ